MNDQEALRIVQKEIKKALLQKFGDKKIDQNSKDDVTEIVTNALYEIYSPLFDVELKLSEDGKYLDVKIKKNRPIFLEFTV